MAINIYLFLVFVNFFCSEMVSYRFSSKLMTRSRRLVSFSGFLSWACNGSSFELGSLLSNFSCFPSIYFYFVFVCPGVLPRPFWLPSSCFGFLIQVTLAVFDPSQWHPSIRSAPTCDSTVNANLFLGKLINALHSFGPRSHFRPSGSLRHAIRLAWPSLKGRGD